MQKLSELKWLEKAIIVDLDFSDLSIKRRLMELGLVPGTPIFLKKQSPGKDPSDYQLLDYELCLQKKVADHILVEKCL